MRNNNSKDRLYLFVIISLVIHLGLFYFLPWGGFATGINPEGRTMEDFEFVQFIDFEEIPQEGQEVNIEDEMPADEFSEEVPESETEEDSEVDVEDSIEEAEELSEDQQVETTDEPTSNEEETPEDSEEEVLTVEESEENIETEDAPEEDTVQIEETPESQQEELAETEETANGGEEDQIEEETEETEDTTPPPAGELVLTSQEPVYPKYSVGPGETGEVIISARVDIDGEIIGVSVAESSGVESMDLNAKNTIEHGWDFNSYSRPYTMEIFVSYNLDEKGDPIIDYELLELSLD